MKNQDPHLLIYSPPGPLEARFVLALMNAVLSLKLNYHMK